MNRILYLHLTLLCVLCFVSVSQVEAQYLTYNKYMKAWVRVEPPFESGTSYNVYRNGYYTENRIIGEKSWRNVSRTEFFYDSLRLNQTPHFVDTTKAVPHKFDLAEFKGIADQVVFTTFKNCDSLDVIKYTRSMFFTPPLLLFVDSVKGTVLLTCPDASKKRFKTPILYTDLNDSSVLALTKSVYSKSEPILTLFVDTVRNVSLPKFNVPNIKEIKQDTIYTRIKNSDSLDVDKYISSLSSILQSTTLIDKETKNTVKVAYGNLWRSNSLLRFKPTYTVYSLWNDRENKWVAHTLNKYTFGTVLRNMDDMEYHWDEKTQKWKLYSQKRTEYDENIKVIAEMVSLMDKKTNILVMKNIKRNTYEKGLLVEELQIFYHGDQSIQSMYKTQYNYNEHKRRMQTIKFRFDDDLKTWVLSN